MKSLSLVVLLSLVFAGAAIAQQLPFSKASVTLPQLAYSACAWGDYDHDGDLDLALSGVEGNNPLSKIFRNDNGNFTDIQADLLSLHYGSVEWGDFDTDGDLDLLVTGIESNGAPHTVIYKNTNGSFADAGVILPGIIDGQASWSDFNNDGYNDLLFTGLDVFEVPKTEVYLNNLGDTSVIAINTPPSPPLNPGASMEAGKLTLHWNSSFDAQTPKNALTYNVRIGTLPDSHEIMSPLAVLYNGYRTIAAPGNASADTSWIITGIPSGTYYFSVQAIDNGFMPGAFSSPYMFSYAAVGVDSYLQPTFSITPNPCHDRLTIHDTESINASSGFRILNASGKIMLEGINSAIINVTSWPEGIYFLQKTSGRETTTVRFFKN